MRKKCTIYTDKFKPKVASGGLKRELLKKT